MAGDWIKMRTDLHDDPAVVMIASALKINEDEVVGKLHRLWGWANRHTVDGVAPAITIPWIDRYVGRRGFADAMILAKWLIVTTDGIRIPRFDRHNGESAKSRAEATERKRVSRESHAKSVTELGQTSHEPRPETVTREEKRREEQDKPPDGGPVWSECLAILTDQGLSERTSRAYLGMLCREWEEPVIVEAVKAAIGKADVKAYISGVLKSRPKRGERGALKVAV